MKSQAQSFWGTPKGFATIGLIGIIGYFLYIEHRQHIFDALPFLLLGACLLMHVFMHRGHGHGSDHKTADDRSAEESYRRGVEDGKRQARITQDRENNDAD